MTPKTKNEDPKQEPNLTPDDTVVDKLCLHIEMLDSIQVEVDQAVQRVREELSALTAEANYTLRNHHERLNAQGEKPDKNLRKQLESIQEKQEKLAEANPTDTVQFLRLYYKYLQSILQLNSDS